jgi:quercetin dioxygenase-like cupin family protein
MFNFDLHKEAEFATQHHVEKILERVGDGDVTVACWSPGQISPNHCHPFCSELYLCIYGGGLMRTETRDVEVTPGSFVLHPPGEVHEYVNGPQNTLLFRVRYGGDPASCHCDDRGVFNWVQKASDAEYFAKHPVSESYLGAVRKRNLAAS